MNRELRGLLAEAGYARALDADVWRGILVIRNAGAVPPPAGVPPESGQKDFKLLLLDRGGRATHFARCGASADHLFRRENGILAALCAHPALARTIPHTRSACSRSIRLQLTAYIPGRSFADIVRRQSAAQWARSASEILETSEAMTRCAEEVLPDLRAAGDTVPLADEAASRLELLAGAGIPAPILDALRTALGSVPPLRRRLQHGDLWAGNVLRFKGSWWLIDFAEFGHAQVPMYDVFLFVHFTWLMLDVAAVRDDWADASRHVVRAAAGRMGLSPRDVAASMIYYLVHMAAYRLRHGAHYVDRAPFLRAILSAAESLLAGTCLESLALPWEHGTA